MASSLVPSTDEKQRTTTKASEVNDGGTPVTTILASCANDPDFAIICAFLQKFNKDLGIEMPNIKHLQEWLAKTNEVSPNLRDLHIKLLRKTRKTVHEKSWESAVSKFCFTYSAQDGWEIERFGYKNSSIKVKLRILKELLESQFERNMKFRAKIVTVNADTLRSQPIGRDRLGHTYWMTQDNDCNFRIYQEHLDEEIWQVVATNRDEFVNLIERLKGNEVVLPSADIGVTDEDTTTSSTSSSSKTQENNGNVEEHKDHEWRQRIPNIRIKLNNRHEIKQEPENNVNETELTENNNASLTNLTQKKASDVRDDEEMEETDEDETIKFEITKQVENAVHTEKNILKVEIQTNSVTDEIEFKFEIETGTKPVTKEVEKLGECNDVVNSFSLSANSNKKREADRMAHGGEDNQGMITSKKCRLFNHNNKKDNNDTGKKIAQDSAGQNIDEKYKESVCIERHNKDDVIGDKCRLIHNEEKVEVEQIVEGKKGGVVKVEEENVGDDIEEKDIDSAAAEEDEHEEREIEEVDQDEEDDDGNDNKIIKESVFYVHGYGAGSDCDSSSMWLTSMLSVVDEGLAAAAVTQVSTIVGDVIEEKLLYVYGEGNGNDCLVGNDNKHEPNSSVSANMLEESETVITLSLENVTNNDNDGNHYIVTNAKINKTSSADHDKSLKIKSLNMKNKNENSETQCKNNSSNNCEIQSASSNRGSTEVTEENSNTKAKQVILSERSKTSTVESPFKKDDEKRIQVKSVLNMSNKYTAKEKKAVLETIKKELRESKEKSLESNIQMIKECNIAHADTAFAASTITTMDILADTTTAAITVATDTATATATTVHAVDMSYGALTDKAAVAAASSTLLVNNFVDTANAADMATASVDSVTKTNLASITTFSAVMDPTAKIASVTPNAVTTLTTTTPALTGTAMTSITTATTAIAVNVNNNSTAKVAIPGKGTAIPKFLQNSRKRRLDDTTVPSKMQMNNSESDIDRQSENVTEASSVEDIAAGGKRLKRRGKQTYMDLRKKVEAQKVAVKSDTTSSSDEEDSGVGSKNFKHPAKQKLLLLLPKKKENKSVYSTEETHCFDKKISSGSHQLFLPECVQDQVEVTSKIKSDEIIKKNVNENSKSTTFCTEPRSIAKKPIITKPLKKNLLTHAQRQEEEKQQEQQEQKDDEETFDVETFSKKCTGAGKIKLEDDETKLVKASSSKSTNCKNRLCGDKSDTSDTDINKDVDIKKKQKTNEHEVANSVKSITNHTVENCESLSGAEKGKVEFDEPNHNKVIKSHVITTNRRSGRHSGCAVLHTELYQPKRTRSLVKKIEKPIKIDKITETLICDPVIVPDVKNFSTDHPNDKANVIKCDERGKKVNENSKSFIESNAKKQELKTLTIKTGNTKMKKTASPIKISSEKLNAGTSNINIISIRGRGCQKKSEVDAMNIIDAIDSETPVRQSRRIAQQKIREEAERRKLEEIALRTMKQELKKKKKAAKQSDPTVLEPSETSSESEDSLIDTKRKTQKRKCPGKNGSWSSDSDDQVEVDDEEEDEEPHNYETDPGSPLYKSDHEFSPESDLEDETQIIPMKRARTVKKEDASTDDDKGGDEEEACQKCGKSDHPEWILLCDICDKGYHCSCLSPVLFYIPEGDWYCPPCQQQQLIAALENKLKELDDLVLLKKQEAEAKRVADEKEELEKFKVCNELEGTSDSSDEFLSTTKTNIKNKYKNSDKMERSNLRTNRRRRRVKFTLGESETQDDSDSSSKSNSSSSFSESDNEPIYKLRKRRQINVSYRLNEYDDLINSALKKEMDEAAGAGNLGRGKDITTIIEADKEEKARQKLLEEERNEVSIKQETGEELLIPLNEECERKEENDIDNFSSKKNFNKEDEIDIESNKRKLKPKLRIKKKSRKLTKLDISSEDDDASDEDFKTFSNDGDDDEEEDDEDSYSISTSGGSDSILETSRRRSKKKSRQRKAARRSIRKRRKGRKFVIEDSDEDDEDNAKLSTLKKKVKRDSDYTETEIDDEYDLSELTENIDSADLCDDTTSEESDSPWRPNKRKKHSKQHSTTNHNLIKCKKNAVKKQKKVEYSDDDISESEEGDGDDANGNTGKGSGKQPRSQPVLKHSLNTVRPFTGKGKGKVCSTKNKKKTSKSSEDVEASFSDSGDSARRTRGRRYAYIEDFDDDSSDGGIKPGVERPDTPPEEREKFIQRQEEIKRMLAEKNSEGAKMAATPRLTPIKSNVEKSNADKKSPSKFLSGADSLSTVPISVIRQAKALDVDYLQRKGGSISNIENDDVEDGDDVDDFDDADLPDDLPDDMDEDAIARMVEDEEDFGTTAVRDLPPAEDTVKTISIKVKEDKSTILFTPISSINTNPVVTSSFIVSLATNIMLSSAAPTNVLTSNLQEPSRKKLPIPTTHPPLLRHQFPLQNSITSQILPRIQHGAVASHLLQNALSAPLSQPLLRNYPFQTTNHPDMIDRLNRGISLMPSTSRSIQGKSPNTSPVHLVSSARVTKDVQSTLHIKGQLPIPFSSQSMLSAAIQHEAKPRGRRKKITPLRDTLQKQQAAAAATAAATTVTTASSNKVISTTMVDSISIIKDPGLPLSTTSLHTSVITTSSHSNSAIHLPLPSPANISVLAPPVPTSHQRSTIRTIPSYSSEEGFYGSSSNRSVLIGTRHRTPATHNLPSSLLQSHAPITPPYGLSPPLKGTSGNVTENAPPSNHTIPTTRPSNVHTRFPTVSLAAVREHQLSSYICAAQPIGSSVNHFRTQLYNNPNFGARLVPSNASNLRRPPLPSPHNVAYSINTRSFPPYVYYPPPPPLTTQIQPQQQRLQGSGPLISAPFQATVTASASTSVIVVAPPAAPSIIVSSPNILVSDHFKSLTVTSKSRTSTTRSKSPPPSPDRFICETKSITNQLTKKLTALGTYSTNTVAVKSPLPLGSHDSLNARNSPSIQIQTDTDPPGDSSSSHEISDNANTDQTLDDKDLAVSEFSGLVSYFSSQHNDYNT